MSNFPMPATWVCERLREGIVIPAHPLALDAEGRLDEKSQIALGRYYHAAGAGGVAVGVHTTQFEIRAHGLLAPVLELAAQTLIACDERSNTKTVKVAGICGSTDQAISEAKLASELEYHAGLLSFGGWQTRAEEELLEHTARVAREIPIFGFYLQRAVGGRRLSQTFWRRFLEIPNVIAIKVAPFNRYQTLDVVRALAESGRERDVTLYTGNDDHIFLDLVTEYVFPSETKQRRVRIAGGLLGHWACWTSKAVEHLQQAKEHNRARSIPATWLTLAEQVTDANSALFDAANQFAGCIPGIHEVLFRQGLMTNTRCLDEKLRLSPGQKAEIDRVCQAYPHLTDDLFVTENLARWRS